AEIYWDVQRNEGEPVFSEFLGLLRSESLKSLAIDVVNEVEALGSLDDVVESAVGLFKEVTERDNERQLTARTAEDDVEALRKLSENRRMPDLRRTLDVGTNNPGARRRPDSYRR